jgi:hypothetical protein
MSALKKNWYFFEHKEKKLTITAAVSRMEGGSLVKNMDRKRSEAIHSQGKTQQVILKGLSHQIINAWKLYQSKAVG